MGPEHHMQSVGAACSWAQLSDARPIHCLVLRLCVRLGSRTLCLSLSWLH
jgi:hypothetical protein